MRSRTLILLVVALVAAAAVAVGAVVARAQSTPSPLPGTTASQLLTKMAQADGAQQGVSGDISWHNGLFGDLGSIVSQLGAPAQNPLLSSGSGRIWMSSAGVRAESQGSGGDQVVVINKAKHDAWVYDYANNSATHYVGQSSTSVPPTSSPSPAALTPAAVSAMLQQLAPVGSVHVTGQTSVAGQQAYVLTFTPSAATSAIGSVQVAVDGTTYVPLRLQVFAKGDSSSNPTLEIGFTDVTYGSVSSSNFDFTPPAGTTVTTHTVGATSQQTQQEQQLKTQLQQALSGANVNGAVLTQSQAAKLVPFSLVTSSDSSLPFRAAVVFKHGLPVSSSGSPIVDLSGLGTTAGASSALSTLSQSGPAVVQVFGSGLGSVVLVQAPSTSQTQSLLKQLPSVFGSTSVAGNPAALVTTPLGGAAVWQQGNTTVVAAGLVTAADLKAFTAAAN